MQFEQAFAALMGEEGRYSNDPNDPGGETMWGITRRVALANGYTGQMKDLPKEVAQGIAKKEYWSPVRCDDLPDPLRFAAFSEAYNTGTHEAIVMLQRVANVKQDGDLGPVTLTALEAVPVDGMRMKFAAASIRFYTTLPTWHLFGAGWMNRVAENLERDE